MVHEGLVGGSEGAGSVPADAVRIAMWSGPRTLSTAMMRSWENRAGATVVDEPFYAYYLRASGLDHPGREEILASQPTDWREVAREMTTGPLPPGSAIRYQKHMTHHMLPEVDLSTLAGLRHTHLIRSPRLLLASYAKVRGEPTLADLGVRRQVELFRRFGGPVVDAGDLCAPRSRCCGRSAGRSACRSTRPCCPGRRGHATPMACGHRTGTTRWRPPPASAPRARTRVPSCRTGWRSSPRRQPGTTTRWRRTGCVRAGSETCCRRSTNATGTSW